MKVRFFNTYEPVTSTYRDLCPALVERGHTVEIVVSRAQYRPGRWLNRKATDLDGVDIRRTTSFGLDPQSGSISKALVGLLYYLHAAWIALWSDSSDVNLFFTQPPFIYTLGRIVRIIKKEPYVCVVMDLQPQLAISLDLLNAGSLVARVLRRVSDWGFARAARVVAIGRCMRKRLVGQGLDRRTVKVIPNWASGDVEPVPRERNSLLRWRDWRDCFILMYAGNLGLPQYFRDLLTVARKHDSSESSKFRVVLIGEGASKEELTDTISEEGLENVSILPFLHEKYSLSEIISAADVHFVTLRSACSGYAVPSKTYNIMACGRPILFQGDPESEIGQMIQEEKIGTVVEEDRAQDLESAILRYVENRKLVQRQGRRALQLSRSEYGKRKRVDEYISLLDSVGTKKPSP